MRSPASWSWMVAVRSIAYLGIVFLATGTAAACSRASESESESAGSTMALPGTQWVVSSVGGRPVVPGTRISLDFTAEGVGGYNGCNWYGARHTLSGDSLRIEAPTSTAVGCTRPAGIGEQEAAFNRTLQQVTGYRSAGERLELINATGDVIIAATPRPRAAMNPADLVGTRWRLRTVNDSVRPLDSLLTLEFTASEIAGFAGCRAYSGTYRATGDEIRVTSLTMASTECNASRAVAVREGDYTTELSTTAYYRLLGDSLEFLTWGGRRLVFAAQR